VLQVARERHLALVGNIVSGLIALYWFWKILSTPGDP
jgi:hypothetical protein